MDKRLPEVPANHKRILLGDLLEDIEQFQDEAVVYVARSDDDLTIYTECVVFVPSEAETIDEIVYFGELLGIIDIITIRNVVEVARETGSNQTKHELLIALKYYLDNDAFIN